MIDHIEDNELGSSARTKINAAIDAVNDAAAAIPPVENRYTLVGLTGGGSTKLDGIVTAGVAVGKVVVVTLLVGSNVVFYVYRLITSTLAESAPFNIRPDDYNGTTNTKIWRLIDINVNTITAAGITFSPDGGSTANAVINGAGEASFQSVVAGLAQFNRVKISQLVLTYSATTVIDFSAGDYQIVALTGNVTFTFASLAADAEVTLEIQADSSSRTLAFPSGVRVVGVALPSSIAANKIVIVSFRSNGTTAANVRAAVGIEA